MTAVTGSGHRGHLVESPRSLGQTTAVICMVHRGHFDHFSANFWAKKRSRPKKTGIGIMGLYLS